VLDLENKVDGDQRRNIRPIPEYRHSGYRRKNPSAGAPGLSTSHQAREPETNGSFSSPRP
jgi:hypothetical protein